MMTLVKDTLVLLIMTIFACIPLAKSIQGNSKLSALQHKLIADLLNGYDKDSHPGGNMAVMVSLGAKLSRLVKVEEVNNIIKAQWWMKQSWSNPDLRWNESEYGNIDAIFVEPTRVWVPDILLYNNGDEKVDAAGGTEKYKTKIKITSNGVHTWFAPTILTSMCKIDIQYFPFDAQVCILQFGSWSYDSSRIDIEVDKNETRIHQDIYQENNEWKVISLTGKNRSKRYPCCKYPYTDVIVEIKMHRRSWHYVVNLVFPCAVIAAMVFCTFFLPAESGERISLCITVLMAMTIFQELTSQKLPASSEGFILIEMYYTTCIVAISLAILATCVVINFYYRRTNMPGCVRRILLGRLARLLGVTPIVKTLDNDLHQIIPNSVAEENDDVENHNVVILKSISPVSPQNNELPRDENTKPENQSNGQVSGGLKKRSNNEQKEMKQPQSYKDATHDNVEDWRIASHVLDRLAMAIGLVMAITSTAGIFLQAPRVRDFFKGG